MNGLIAEPGWRWPLVARLNGLLLEVVAAHHRLHLAGLVLDRHERGARARAAEPPGDRLLGRRLELGVERGRDLQPAAEHRAGAVAVHELLGHPAREVGLRRVGLRRRRCRAAAGMRRRAAPSSYSAWVIMSWSSMLREHEVAPLARGDRVLDRVVGARRGDHARRAARPRRASTSSARSRSLGAYVAVGARRSRCAPPTRRRRRRSRSRRCSGTG